jgi:hypothetical protein
MKVLNIIKFSFTILGLLALLVALLLYLHTRTFLQTAVVTQGTVVDLAMVQSERSNTSSAVSVRFTTGSYAPVVRFRAENGHDYQFTSPVSTYPPAYDVGENIEVLYEESDPNKASINSFFFLWGGALIIGGLGFLFAAIGLIMFSIGLFKSRKKQRLTTTGVRIKTRFHSVLLNPGLEVNGRNPYLIRSEWKNPRNAEVHFFDSDNIWSDPSGLIPDEITVYIERENPKEYFLDLSFLPAT